MPAASDIDMGMLAADIADMLDRYEYPLDVSQDDVAAALPAFVAALIGAQPMGLYMLERPAVPGEADGFLVAARDERAARRFASGNFGNEGREPWLDPARSNCALIGHVEGRARQGVKLRSMYQPPRRSS